MAHLGIEKGLKGLWTAKLGTSPPKTHNLIYLVEKIGAELTEEVEEHLTVLNDAGVPTRYPDNLSKMMADYPEDEVRSTLSKSRETLTWIKAQR